MLSRIKHSIRACIEDKYLFHGGQRGLHCRQSFFYNAWQALTFNGIAGDYVEFGCHGGNTFGYSWRESRRMSARPHLWAFDSFEGLPAQQEGRDFHPAWVPGSMATSLNDFHAQCRAAGVPRIEYTAVPGFYDVTLPALGESGEPKEIALAYVDCDLYSSTQSVLQFLKQRLQHGMIIGFDDYYCWSASQISGNRLAMLEAFEEETPWRLIPYLPIGWHGQSFFLEDQRLRIGGRGVATRK